MPEFRFGAVVSSAIVPVLLTILLTYISIKILRSRGITVEDVHKSDRPRVPRPGGPALVTSFLISEILIFSDNGDVRVLAVVLATAIAAIVGLADDLYVLKGYHKPVALVMASVPILLLGTYNFRPAFPIFGPVRLPIVYPLIVLIAISVTANTFNSLDVLNGLLSSYTAIVTVPILFALAIKGDQNMLLATLPLLFTSVGFYLFHRYPSRIFPGDSGALTLGAAYGSLAIVGGVEIVAIVAILPAIMNSFFFLSSVKKIVEHRAIKVRPTVMQGNGTLAASKDPRAPITIVRLILADGPLTERNIVHSVMKLAGFTSILAAITALLTWGLHFA